MPELEPLPGLLKGFPESWRPLLSENALETAAELNTFLFKRQAEGATLFPMAEDWFTALQKTAPTTLTCCILGQDPYHGAGQAHGLAFSVPEGIKPPPSLRNIIKELRNDAQHHPWLVEPQILDETHPDLTHWAKQGVLLLNSVLTVEENSPGSHRNRGWEVLTDSLVQNLAASREGLVFVLWGQYAQAKRPLIDEHKHLVLASAHPSPLSARRGFFGSQPFSAINRWLLEREKPTIRW